MKEVIVSPKAVEEINEKIELTQDGIAIVADGDTHAAIGDGQFVYVRNHGTLAEGMYRATTAIGENVALTTSNLAVDNAGGLNALKSDVDTLSSKFALVQVVTPIKNQAYTVDYPNGFTRDNCTMISAYLLAYNNKYYGSATNIQITLLPSVVEVTRIGAADNGNYTCGVLLYRVY